MIYKLLNIAVSDSDFDTELQIVKIMALNNRYPTFLINKI